MTGFLPCGHTCEMDVGYLEWEGSDGGPHKELGCGEVGLGPEDRTRIREWRSLGGWPVSELYERFFTHGLSPVNQDAAGEGVSSLLLKMCKSGLGAVPLADTLTLPAGALPPLGQL